MTPAVTLSHESRADGAYLTAAIAETADAVGITVRLGPFRDGVTIDDLSDAARDELRALARIQWTHANADTGRYVREMVEVAREAGGSVAVEYANAGDDDENP